MRHRGDNTRTWAVSIATPSTAPSKCPVTMMGCSLSVTVKAPNAPWAQTHTKVAVAHQGDRPPACRMRQASSIKAVMRAPTPVAR